MNLHFDISVAEGYESASQKARVLTEHWVDNHIFCPNCGYLDVVRYESNRPVADFYCSKCNEEYELKSKKNFIGGKILDGAYSKKIERLQSSSNPSLFILTYDESWDVTNFLVIPKQFFVPAIIEKRKPLAPKARRAGWVGSNIILEEIPDAGKIYYVRNCQVQPKENVVEKWRKTLFLREQKKLDAKGWTLDVMICIEKINRPHFSLDEVYDFEEVLFGKHPENKHVRDKIRQQLQILRDKGYLEFVKRGEYRLM